MSSADRISLNAIRIFARAAQRGGIALAAADLGVTPSAVSHQIRRLEQALGVALLNRSGAGFALSPQGRALAEAAAPGLDLLQGATERALRDGSEITLRCGMTFALRWLVPALERFKRRRRAARIRLETTAANGVQPGPAPDIDILYLPCTADDGQDETLLADRSCPVVSPALLGRSGYRGPGDIARLPVLASAAGNWDWREWCARTGIDFAALSLADSFDVDDPVLRAAAAGLGMALSPALMVRDELAAGTLVALPGFAPVLLGRYVIRTAPGAGPLARAFHGWLSGELAPYADGGWP